MGEPQTGGENIENGQGHQVLPAKAHQLVVTEPGKGAAHPDVQKKETENLQHKPEHRHDGLDHDAAEGGNQRPEGAGPSAKKEQSGHAADGDHVGVLGHEEHGKLHRAVFGVVAGCQLGLSLGQIERGAVGLGIGRDEVNEEADELKAPKDVP